MNRDSPAGALPARYTIANEVYVDPRYLDLEMERIFGRSWVFVAHESELPRPGDFITTTVGRTPLVVVRNRDGGVDALLNVCPHRAATVVREPSGHAKAFTCLFHHWVFDTTGRCLSITQPDGYADAGLGTGDFGLRAYRADEIHGLVFVTLADDAPPLADYIGPALDGVAEVLDTRPLEVFHFHRIEVAANWKLWAATNVELYHVWLHSLNRASSLKSEAWLERALLPFPNGHVAFAPAAHDYRQSELDARDLTLPGLAPNEARIAHIFPDLLVNVRASCLRLDRLVPLGPARVLVECRGLGILGEPAEDRRRRVQDHNQFWGPFGRNVPEDALATTAQMRAMQSGSLRHSVVAREAGSAPAVSDASLRHFHAEWCRRLGLEQGA